jgi:hypothetical protein
MTVGGYIVRHNSALVLVSLAGGFGAAWFVEKQLEPWRLAAKAVGGPRYVRADRIAAGSTIAAFLVGTIATYVVFYWNG